MFLIVQIVIHKGTKRTNFILYPKVVYRILSNNFDGVFFRKFLTVNF